jgi:FkbH-like protein
MNFDQLTKNLKKDFSKLRKMKIALLGDSSTQFLVRAIKGWGFELGVNFDIFEADYDQIERQILAESELYQFKPEFVIVFLSTERLLGKFYKSSKSEKVSFAEKQISEISHLYQIINATLTCKIIFFNFIEINDAIYGNYANKTELSFVYQARKLNYELMNLSHNSTSLFINDIASLHNTYGSIFCHDPKTYINGDVVFSLDFLPIVARNLCDIIQALSGSFKKCLILDLDNTLWGGIIGDDGIENIQIGDLGIGKAFTELQLWMKELKQRGIILAVCSANSEAIAKEPFEKHPDMVLRLEDIAVFVANWNNKAENIRYIQSILNIGFDSMVFLDDNPFERNLVKTHIPEITIPDLPEDPAEYLGYLRTLNLFETSSVTDEDEQRTKQYREEAKRVFVQKEFTNEDEFLSNLAMVSLVKPFDAFTIPRVAQLTQRSNQFNLRTIRYTDDEIRALSRSEEYRTLSFSLEDRIGDYGLVSVVILKKQSSGLFIDTWIMSCRVLKREMEHFVLNTIVRTARHVGSMEIVGEYIRTAKNEMVKDHYKNLGFTKKDNFWILQTESFTPLPHHISAKQ